MKRPRVILADDHRIVSEGLKSLLLEEFELVAIVEDGRALIDAAKQFRPDVIVSDITMPGLNGLDGFVQLKKEMPHVKVVFLSMHHDVAFARRAIESGALGYVLKHSAASELVMAIRAALAGKTFITPALAGEVFQSIRFESNKDASPVSRLTPRQREILQLFAEGRSAKEVAATLGISPRTVEFHKYQMMDSMHIENSAELVHFAIKHGVVTV